MSEDLRAATTVSTGCTVVACVVGLVEHLIALGTTFLAHGVRGPNVTVASQVYAGSLDFVGRGKPLLPRRFSVALSSDGFLSVSCASVHVCALQPRRGLVYSEPSATLRA